VIEIRRILCPVDYSEFSRRALDHAVTIAKWYNATITVFHVSSFVPVVAYGPAGPIPAPIMLTPDNRARILDALRQFAEAEGGSSVPLECDVAEGNAATEILAKSEAMSSDLLVLGTHGLSGFDRFMLGSVTEKVLRKATCPVLSVPSRAPDVVPIPSALFHRILCAIDFSDCSMHALTYAASLAQETDARLTVLNVVEQPFSPASDRDEGPMGLPHALREYITSVEAECREALAKAVPESVRAYCRVETLVGEGKPYREILRVANEQKSDLIVMGVRGRGAADLLLFGSTVQHVVRQAVCPVLTLRKC
jgi:nucleotide-binding universal stress UspA family protein